MNEEKINKFIEDEVDDVLDVQFIDGECGFWLWHRKEESQKVCDKLNELNEENEELKKENKQLKNSVELYMEAVGGML